MGKQEQTHAQRNAHRCRKFPFGQKLTAGSTENARTHIDDRGSSIITKKKPKEMAASSNQQQLYEAIAQNDHEALLQLYGQAAVEALVNYNPSVQRNGGIDTDTSSPDARGAFGRCPTLLGCAMSMVVGTSRPPNFVF